MDTRNPKDPRPRIYSFCFHSSSHSQCNCSTNFRQSPNKVMLPQYKMCSIDSFTILRNQTGVDRSLIQIVSHLKFKYTVHPNEVIPFHSTPGMGPNITTHYEETPETAPLLTSSPVASCWKRLHTLPLLPWT